MPLKCFFSKFFSNGKCDPCQPGFGSVLLKALLDNMSFLPAAATGGM
jgi:baculoviral IAP repeat-containing protein 6